MSRFAIRNPHSSWSRALCWRSSAGQVSRACPSICSRPSISPSWWSRRSSPACRPKQIETDITGRFERFFTLASGIEHIESRSLPGVSLIKIYFQPGTDADAAVTQHLQPRDGQSAAPAAGHAAAGRAEVRRLQPARLPDHAEGRRPDARRGCATSANTPCAIRWPTCPAHRCRSRSAGKYRQIMVYVDPIKLEAHQLSLMDVVRAVNESNLILPAGDVQIGPVRLQHLHQQPGRARSMTINADPAQDGERPDSVTVGDIGEAKDAAADPEQHRARRRPAVGLSARAQAGRRHEHHRGRRRHQDGRSPALSDVPENLVTQVVFDQSLFVKSAIENAAARRRHRSRADRR